MDLAAKQHQAVERGEAVPVAVDGAERVLLRREVNERVRRVVDYGDRTWTDEERQAMLRSLGENADWDNRALDVYEQYRTRPPKRRHCAD